MLVLHRIVMNVIDMMLEIAGIADEMLPEVPLPNPTTTIEDT
jgi:hypothetical protein